MSKSVFNQIKAGLEEALDHAVVNAIQDVGIDTFKKTSIFLSNGSRELVDKAKKAFDVETEKEEGK